MNLADRLRAPGNNSENLVAEAPQQVLQPFDSILAKLHGLFWQGLVCRHQIEIQDFENDERLLLAEGIR